MACLRLEASPFKPDLPHVPPPYISEKPFLRWADLIQRINVPLPQPLTHEIRHDFPFPHELRIIMLLGLAAAAAAAFLLRLLFRTSLFFFLRQCWVWIDDRLHAYQSFKVPRLHDNGQENQLYRRVLSYLNSLPSLEDSDSTNLFAKSSNEIVLAVDPGQTVVDTFLSSRLSWTNAADPGGGGAFVLRVRRRDRRRILRPYLQHIHTVSDEIEQRRSEVGLFLNSDGGGGRRWTSVPFTHPATIDNVVLDRDLKSRVKGDLEVFLKSKQYYHRLGRVWKRSYLLHGSSGAGKTSLVAAMARILCYDVYAVDLSGVSDALDLKALLLQTTPKSLIVVEDVDRFLADRCAAGGWPSALGALGFMDGVFSACGEERVVVFTMDTRDRVDPAVLRPGRVDVHVHFPPCDFSAFKTLASTHLGLKDHKLFPRVEESFQAAGSGLSSAEVGEIMISNRASPSRALKSVITALQAAGGGAAKAGGRPSAGQLTVENPSDGETVVCKESIHMVREFRKLYGLLRMRSGRKDEPFELADRDLSRHGNRGGA